ncbi:hypothetical protein D3C71_1543360 [compost metagenome]
MRPHERGQARRRRDHEQKVARDGAQHRGHAGAFAMARRGVQDGDGARARNGLEYQDGEDKTAVVLDVEHAASGFAIRRIDYPVGPIARYSALFR